MQRLISPTSPERLTGHPEPFPRQRRCRTIYQWARGVMVPVAVAGAFAAAPQSGLGASGTMYSFMKVSVGPSSVIPPRRVGKRSHVDFMGPGRPMLLGDVEIGVRDLGGKQ